MNIIKQSENLTPSARYAMTAPQSHAKKMSTLVGAGPVEVEQWVIFGKADKDGNPQKVVALKAAGNYYGTISRSFADSFESLVDAFGDDVTISVEYGISRAGRKFIFCRPAEARAPEKDNLPF